MATADVRSILRVPCRLVADPTSMTTAFPHGGTALGIAARITLRPNAQYKTITAEEFGGQVVDRVYCGEAPTLSCVLRGWDADVISRTFPNTSVGSGSGKYYIQYEPDYSGQNRPGYLMTGKAFKLFLSPEALNFAPALLIYNAIPAWDEAAEIAFRDDSEATLPLVFHCLPSSAGRVYEYGWPEDLNVT